MRRQHLFGNGVSLFTGESHTFGTDALLLADFAAPAKGTVCDLGTGCGIIPLYWASRGKKLREVWGVDISDQAAALFLAGIDASDTGETVLHALCADLRELTAASLLGERVDLVTCHPPYQNGKGPKPVSLASAAARHELGCTIGDVCAAAGRLVRYGGRFCLCHKPQRLCDVLCAMRENRLEPKKHRFVAKRSGDTPWLFLVEGKSGGKPGMEVLPPLAVYEGEGYSPEMARIYRQGLQYSQHS